MPFWVYYVLISAKAFFDILKNDLSQHLVVLLPYLLEVIQSNYPFIQQTKRFKSIY